MMDINYNLQSKGFKQDIICLATHKTSQTEFSILSNDAAIKNNLESEYFTYYKCDVLCTSMKHWNKLTIWGKLYGK